MHVVLRIILALVYLYAGFALFFGRKRLVEGGKHPNLVIPAALLVLAAITTLIP